MVGKLQKFVLPVLNSVVGWSEALILIPESLSL